MSFTDFEFIILFLLVAIFYIVGLRKKQGSEKQKYGGIDLSMSTALKGIACVFVLMGHFVTLRDNVDDFTIFSRLVQLTTANIALAIFMFFSGYGLTIKTDNSVGVIIWFKRIKKVYLPLFLSCVAAFLIYALLPEKFNPEEAANLRISQDINYIHHFSLSSLKVFIPHLLGWKDWYVFCIMIFYSLFYISQLLTHNKPANHTWLLWLMMLVYFVLAYCFIGLTEAHWYRYCWAFFYGHVYGKIVKSQVVNRWDLLMLLIMLGTTLLESWFLILSYFMAFLLLYVSARINRSYYMESRVLAFMGCISYFFYLTHIRIGYTFISYLEIHSVLLWVMITVIISWCLTYLYNYMIKPKKI